MKTASFHLAVFWLVISAAAVRAASYTVNVQAGYNFIANQLDRGGNTVAEILTSNVLSGTTLFKFNNGTQTFSAESYDDLFGWEPGTTVLRPGEGAYLLSPAATTLTFTGNPHTPQLPLILAPGTYLLSRQTNGTGTFPNVIGDQPRECSIVYRFQPGPGRTPTNFAAPNYTVHTFRGGAWTPSAPTLAVGECAWFTLPCVCISAPPTNRSVALGGTATFSVTASGIGPLTYQWFKGMTPMGVSSAPSLTIRNVQVEDVDQYWVRVSDGRCSADSAVASLIIPNHSYNLSLPPGFSFIANQLSIGGNTVAEVLPSVPENTTLFFWSEPLQRYDPVLMFFAGEWVGGLAGNTPFQPGTGAVISSLSALNLTFRGEIRPDPRTPGPCQFTGFRLRAAATPKRARYEDIVGVPPCAGAGIHLFDNSITNFRGHFFVYGAWSDGEPIAAIGQPLFVSHRPLAANSGGQSNVQGNTVTFSNFISGGSEIVLYQWRRNGIDVPGATNASITITNAQIFTNFGNYTLTVQSMRNVNSPTTNTLSDVPDAVTGAPQVLKFSLPALQMTNNFEQAFMYTNSSSFTGTVNNASATIQPNEPDHAGKKGGHSLWLSWRAPQAGLVTFRTIGSSFDTLLAAYTNSTLASLGEVASDDDNAGYGTSLITFRAGAAVDYRIAVDGRAGAVGDVVLSWELFPATNAFPRFVRAAASQGVFMGTPVAFTNVLDQSPGSSTVRWFFNGSALSNGANGVTFTNINQTNLVLNITNALRSHVGVYWTELSNVVGNGTATARVQSASSVLELTTQPGVLTRDKFSDLLDSPTNGSFSFSESALAPAAKGFVSVAAGTLNSQTINNLLSSTEPCEPGTFLGGASRWLTLQPVIDGTLTIDTLGSTNDTKLAVYIGTSLCDLASGGVKFVTYDDNSGPEGKTSRAAVRAAAGVNYFVALEAKPKGNIEVNWSVLAQPNFGDSVVLTAPPTNFPSKFQWLRNAGLINGQTNFTLTVTNLDPVTSGTYSVVTTNVLGRVTNTIAFLSPVEMRISNASPAELRTNFNVAVLGPPASNYVFEAKARTDSNTIWQTVRTGNLGTTGVVFITDQNALNYSNRFYRVRSE